MTDEDFDDRDLPDDDYEKPLRLFDLTEEQANALARQLMEMDGVFDINRCVGGTSRGNTNNAWSVNFGLRLSTGHHVRAEIHEPETFDGPTLDTAEQSDPTMDALRSIVGEE